MSSNLQKILFFRICSLVENLLKETGKIKREF